MLLYSYAHSYTHTQSHRHSLSHIQPGRCVQPDLQLSLTPSTHRVAPVWEGSGSAVRYNHTSMASPSLTHGNRSVANPLLASISSSLHWEQLDQLPMPVVKVRFDHKNIIGAQ